MSGDIEGISEGRRKVALEKAEEARREWLRAERAEAEVATLRAEVERLREALEWAAKELELLYFFAISNGIAEAGIPPHAQARAALGEETKG